MRSRHSLALMSTGIAAYAATSSLKARRNTVMVIIPSSSISGFRLRPRTVSHAVGVTALRT